MVQNALDLRVGNEVTARGHDPVTNHGVDKMLAVKLRETTLDVFPHLGGIIAFRAEDHVIGQASGDPDTDGHGQILRLILSDRIVDQGMDDALDMFFIADVQVIFETGTVDVIDIFATADQVSAPDVLTTAGDEHAKEIVDGDVIYIPPLLPEIHSGNRPAVLLQVDMEIVNMTADGNFLLLEAALVGLLLMGSHEVGQGPQVLLGLLGGGAGQNGQFDGVVLHQLPLQYLLFQLGLGENLHKGADAFHGVVVDLHHGVIAVRLGKPGLFHLCPFGHQSVDKDLFLTGGLGDGLYSFHAAIGHISPVLALLKLGHHVEARHAHGGFGRCQQTADGSRQIGIRLLHKQFHGVSPQVVIAQTEHLLHSVVFLRRQGHDLDRHVSRPAGIGALILQSIDDGLADHRGLLSTGQHIEIDIPSKCVAVGKMGAELFHAVLILHHCRNDHGLFHQIGFFDGGPIPGENAGIEDQFLLLHGAVDFHKPVAHFRGLLRGFEIMLPNGILPAVCKGIGGVIGERDEAGEIYRQNVIPLPAGFQNIPRRHMTNQGAFQIGYKITCRQHLMVGPLVNNPVKSPITLLRFLEGVAPQGDMDGHGILGRKALLPEGGVLQAFADQFYTLGADSIKVSGFIRNDADPGAHCTLDGGITDQVVLQNRRQDGLKRLLAAAVRLLTNYLPQTFLKPGGQQKPAQKLMHPGIVAQDNTLNQFLRNGGKFTVAVHDFRDDLLQPGIPFVQLIGQHLRNKSCGAGVSCFEIAPGVLWKIARQHIPDVRIQTVGILKMRNNARDPGAVIEIIAGTETPLAPADRIGIVPDLVHRMEKGVPEPFIDDQIEDPWHFLREKLRGLFIPSVSKSQRKESAEKGRKIFHLVGTNLIVRQLPEDLFLNGLGTDFHFLFIFPGQRLLMCKLVVVFYHFRPSLKVPAGEHHQANDGKGFTFLQIQRFFQGFDLPVSDEHPE